MEDQKATIGTLAATGPCPLPQTPYIFIVNLERYSPEIYYIFCRQVSTFGWKKAFAGFNGGN